MQDQKVGERGRVGQDRPFTTFLGYLLPRPGDSMACRERFGILQFQCRRLSAGSQKVACKSGGGFLYYTILLSQCLEEKAGVTFDGQGQKNPEGGGDSKASM